MTILTIAATFIFIVWILSLVQYRSETLQTPEQLAEKRIPLSKKNRHVLSPDESLEIEFPDDAILSITVKKDADTE